MERWLSISSTGRSAFSARSTRISSTGVVEPVDDGVDLRAQARGEEHGLFEVHAVAQPPEHLGQVGLTDRDPFEQFER